MNVSHAYIHAKLVQINLLVIHVKEVLGKHQVEYMLHNVYVLINFMKIIQQMMNVSLVKKAVKLVLIPLLVIHV